ncbi:glycine-rich cell wall structural protein 1 [Beauveria brongniartii RCEF 3172]|uniref:Glycine-rich cell wall structural protein 1 n=1 Tax=Beauveria brongniartii RCEF 3172 TaxID=1081107 RepID=A0A162JSE7_9HYPO|nr:glycine-rich cell wall structural protein 1 [Beauveria brongniartii RCEF 3172]
MDTVSQMATTAAKYVFGDSANQEPLSGTQGDVTKGEPYDAGNLDPSDQERLRQHLSGAESRDVHSSNTTATTSSSSSDKPIDTKITSSSSAFGGVSKTENTGPITKATNAADNAGFTHPEHDMSAPGRSSSGQGFAGGVTTATNRTTDSGFTTPGQDMGGSARNTSGFDNTSSASGLDSARNTSGFDNNSSSSSTNKQSTSTQNLNTTGQNLTDQNLDNTRDVSASNIDSKSKPSKSPSADANDEPSSVNVSGPGPRNLSTVARENGGDAGSHRGSETTSTSNGNKQPGSSGAGAGGNLPADRSQEKGTGEEYVKSSGLQADGGDFDATRPGAGREADRLMEQKGITTAAGAGAGGGAAAAKGKDGAEHKARGNSGSGDSKEKHGLVDKIKEKLHKH